MEPFGPQFSALFQALRRNQEDTDRFFSTDACTVPIAEFSRDITSNESYVRRHCARWECRRAYEQITRNSIYLPNSRNVIPTMIVRE
jgi:hypothetical protein